LPKEFWAIYRLSFANRRDPSSVLFFIIVTYYYAAVSGQEKINATKLPGKHGKEANYPAGKNIFLKRINIVTSRFICVSIVRLINIAYMKRYRCKYSLTIMRYCRSVHLTSDILEIKMRRRELELDILKHIG